MKKFLPRIIHFLKRVCVISPKTDINTSFIGSWRLVSLADQQGNKHYPRWKEVWSFAAMDEAETNGVYACDYINLHTIIGKWELMNGRLKLVRKECESEYLLVELSGEKLVLKPSLSDSNEELVFQRVV